MSNDQLANLIDASELPIDPEQAAQQSQNYIRAALGAGLRRDGHGMTRMVARVLDEHGRYGAFVATDCLATMIATHLRPSGAGVPVRLDYRLPDHNQRDRREFQQRIAQLADLAVSGCLTAESRVPSALIAAYRDDLAYAEPVLMFLVRFLVNTIAPLKDLAHSAETTWADYKDDKPAR